MLLNGEQIAVLIGPNYFVDVPQTKLLAKNKLEVIVSNGMANRIQWMDKNGENYKIFYNINMPSRLPQNRGKDGLFTSKNWQALPSGLLQDVKLIPLKTFIPEAPQPEPPI